MLRVDLKNKRASALYNINLAEYSKKVCPFFRMSRKYFNLYLKTKKKNNCCVSYGATAEERIAIFRRKRELVFRLPELE